MSEKGKALDIFVVEYINGRKWKLKWDFGWKFRDGSIIHVRPFIFDFNSMPKLLWHIVLPTEYGEASVVHDWLYKNNGLTDAINPSGEEGLIVLSRRECDIKYREILEDTSCGKVRTAIMYRVVRLIGWYAWNQHKRRNKRGIL